MKILNIYVSTEEAWLFIKEKLLKMLCQNNISYVIVDNEVHCLDYIIRFLVYCKTSDKFNLEEYLKLEYELLLKESLKLEDSLFIIEDKHINYIPTEPYNKFKQNNVKKLIKQQNKIVNQKLKRSR